MKQQQGFTLIELLIGMSLITIVFAIIASITSSMSRSSTILNTKSELAQDAQIAQRIIMGRLAEAIYVYPPGTAMRLADSGVTTDNLIRPRRNRKWTVNYDPFVAMLLPPENPDYAPGSNVPTNCTSSNTDGCYRFYAYYATRQGGLTDAVEGGTLKASSAPQADALNAGAWTIMQYQHNLVGWTPSYSTPKDGINASDAPIGAPLKGGIGRVLLTYVEPQTKNYRSPQDLFTGSGGGAPSISNACDMFCVQVPSSDSGKANNGLVEVRFRMLRHMRRGADIKVEGTSPPGVTRPFLGGVVSPRNWWQ